MYEFMILAQLSRRPMHGYMIAKIIGNVVGPFRQVQWGALYPILSRLVRDGMIEVDGTPQDDDGRARKVYAITESGRARLHEHLMDTEHHLGEYAMVFAYKVAFFYQLTVEERLRLCHHYLVYAQQNIDHIERKTRDVQEPQVPLTPEQREDVLIAMYHRLETWKQERQWVQTLIEKNRFKEAI